MQERAKLVRFEGEILPHLDAAYNLARWLLRNDHDAEDVTQEACLRAYRFFEGFRGGNAKAWLLTVVRHACFDWLKQNRSQESMTSFDELVHTPDAVGSCNTPESLALQAANQRVLHAALAQLPIEFCEALILRELEGLSYKEISTVTDVPIGTVMSRLSRARNLLLDILSTHDQQEH